MGNLSTKKKRYRQQVTRILHNNLTKFTPPRLSFIVSNNGEEEENGVHYRQQSLWIALRDALEGQGHYVSIGLLRQTASTGVNANFTSWNYKNAVHTSGLAVVADAFDVSIHIRKYSRYLAYLQGLEITEDLVFGKREHRAVFLLQYQRGNEEHYNALVPLQKALSNPKYLNPNKIKK